MTAKLPQMLIESVIEAVWLVDAVDLRILAVNRAAENMIGLSRAELVGRPVVDFASTSQDLFFWEDVAAGRSRAIRSETLLKRGNGDIRATAADALEQGRGWRSNQDHGGSGHGETLCSRNFRDNDAAPR